MTTPIQWTSATCGRGGDEAASPLLVQHANGHLPAFFGVKAHGLASILLCVFRRTPGLISFRDYLNLDVFVRRYEDPWVRRSTYPYNVLWIRWVTQDYRSIDHRAASPAIYRVDCQESTLGADLE